MGTEVVFKMVSDVDQVIDWVGTMMLGSGMMLLKGIGLQMYLLSKLVAKVLIFSCNFSLRDTKGESLCDSF